MVLDLKSFILRAEVLHLYRSLLRAAKNAQDTAARGGSLAINPMVASRQNLLAAAAAVGCCCSAELPDHSPRSHNLHPLPPTLATRAVELRQEIRRQFEAARHKGEPETIRFMLSGGSAAAALAC